MNGKHLLSVIEKKEEEYENGSFGRCKCGSIEICTEKQLPQLIRIHIDLLLFPFMSGIEYSQASFHSMTNDQWSMPIAHCPRTTIFCIFDKFHVPNLYYNFCVVHTSVYCIYLQSPAQHRHSVGTPI